MLTKPHFARLHCILSNWVIVRELHYETLGAVIDLFIPFFHLSTGVMFFFIFYMTR